YTYLDSFAAIGAHKHDSGHGAASCPSLMACPLATDGEQEQYAEDNKESTHASLTKDGHKHTYIGDPLPDFYLQNTCKFAVTSAITRRPITKRLPCSTWDMLLYSQMVCLSLTFDHRVIDGAPVAAVLHTLKGHLEDP